MMGLESYLGGTDIPLSLKELIKLRASMLNGCAYCIEMHAEVAMKHGESPQRLLALSFEMIELHEQLNFKANNVHAFLNAQAH